MKFYNLLEEPLGFKSFLDEVVVRDPLLNQIWSFISIPPVETPNYPLEIKLKEIQNITQEDCFNNALKAMPSVVDQLIKQFSNTKYEDCYNYIEYLFTPLFFSILDKIVEHPKQSRSIAEIYLQKAACYWIEYPETEQKNISVKVCDFWMPLFREFNVQVRNKQTGKYTEELCVKYHEREPVPSDFYNFWDRHWIDRAKNINEKDEEGREIYKESINKDFRISLIYKNKKLSFKSGKYFDVPLFNRYKPFIKKVVENALKYYKYLYDGDSKLKDPKNEEDRERMIKQGIEWEFKEKFWNQAQKYKAKTKYPYPSGYFKAFLSHFGSEIYKSADVSTEAANVPCDEDCRKHKYYENELLENGSCEFEDSRGFCKDPKRKRVIREKFERSGPPLDAFIKIDDNDDGDTLRRVTLEKGSVVDLDKYIELILDRLNPEEKDLFRAYYEAGLTQNKLAKKYGFSQSTISENLSKLNNNIFDILQYLPEFDYEKLR